MTKRRSPGNDPFRQLRLALRLTWVGMLAERVTQAFWPLWSVLLAAAAALMLGLQDHTPLELVWALSGLAALGALAALGRGFWRFRVPRGTEAEDRLDRTIPGRPISALGDRMAVGAGDPAAKEVWRAHIARMTERVRDAHAVTPDLRVARRDPYALRYVALLAFAMAVLFGSVMRVASVAEMTPGAGGALAAGPAWEGWVEPPAYTGKPPLYLGDINQTKFAVPEASRLTIRLYGEVGALGVTESVSGRGAEAGSSSDSQQSFEIAQSGRLIIDGPGGAEWQIEVLDDTAPSVELTGAPTRGVSGEMRQEFLARDDFGVQSGTARLMLDLDAVDRRHGLALDPESRPAIELDLPITISGDRSEFEETLIENLSQHPWATLPVKLELLVQDALGQQGASVAAPGILPGRRFFDPLAGAIVEQRRDLLWNRANAPRIAQVLRAVSHRPDDVFDSETAYLKLRFALRRLEVFSEYGISDEQQQGLAQVLWDIAVMIEDGNLADAAERLREARERLAEAMRNGATEEEIAELMQELREAMRDYMRQLAQQQQQDGQQSAENQQNMQEITGDQLQALMDRIQELMEQGRMDEAQELLDRMAEMMENMQVTQGENGMDPGEQAMEGLADTLRQQQGLSDDTFGELQEQFNQPGQEGDGQQQGEMGQNGTLPGQQGREGEGNQMGQGQGQNGTPQPGQGERPGLSQQGLAGRQQALRDELNRQQGNLPGAGTPEGDAARDALGRAGRAMDEAEDALRDNDMAGALDSQAEAIEALRDGMRDLGEVLAQQQQDGQQGDAFSNRQSNRPLDPLGREAGSQGEIGTDEQLLQGDDVYRRARELLDEIRRRSGDRTRPEGELDYLRRLLDRF